MFVVDFRLKSCAFVLGWLDKPRVDAVWKRADVKNCEGVRQDWMSYEYVDAAFAQLLDQCFETVMPLPRPCDQPSWLIGTAVVVDACAFVGMPPLFSR